jgi:hypothetical protein
MFDTKYLKQSDVWITGVRVDLFELSDTKKRRHMYLGAFV